MLTVTSAIVFSTMLAPSTGFETVSAAVVGQNAAPKIARRKTLWDTRAVAVAGKPNSSLFAACLEDGRVRIIDAAGKVPGPTLQGHVQPAYGVAWSPDGKYLVTGDEQAKIFMWDAKTGEKLKEFSRLKGHQRGIQSIDFAPDGKSFVSVGKDDSMCVWVTNGSNPIWKVTGEPTNFYGAEFAKSGALVTGTQTEGVRIYAPKTYDLAAKLTLPGGQGATGFTMNEAGTLGVTTGRDTNVVLWDLRNKSRIVTLKGHTDFALNAAMTPNGRYVATSGSDAQVIFWDIKTYKPVYKLEQMSYIGAPVAFTGDGNYFVTCNSSDVIEIHTVTPKQK